MNENEFGSAEKRALSSVLDQMIPARADAALPGAGELGISAAVITALGAGLPATGQALGKLNELAAGQGAEDYAALPDDQRTLLLAEFAASDPGFLLGLLFHAYTAYYQLPPVIEALGLEARPPYPGGYELEVGDLSLLDPVRARPKLYREV